MIWISVIFKINLDIIVSIDISNHQQKTNVPLGGVVCGSDYIMIKEAAINY